MAYQQNIPLATDQLSQSQNDLQNNFQAINTFVNVNHVAFGEANQGMHNEVQMPVNAMPPAGVAGIGQLYTQAVAGVSQLFWQGDVSAAQQLTYNPTLASIGTTKLPGGLLLQWGNNSVAAGASRTVPIAFATGANVNFPNACLFVLVSQLGSLGGTLVGTGAGLTASHFNVFTNGDGSAFNYIAIGY